MGTVTYILGALAAAGIVFSAECEDFSTIDKLVTVIIWPAAAASMGTEYLIYESLPTRNKKIKCRPRKALSQEEGK